MLCKIFGFHGGEYEEFLLGYKHPVRTSQETHYLSATEPRKFVRFEVSKAVTVRNDAVWLL
jgi:hypothetical protein